jgi:hypothetical protein
VLTGKQNYPKWFKNIKHTLIFNDLWDDICEGEADNEGEVLREAQHKSGISIIPTTYKEHAIWNK